MKTFHINGSGILRVQSHIKCHNEDTKQPKFVIEKQTAVLQNKLELTSENQVLNSEIYLFFF